ncbi:hypothetical protein GCM10020367_31990 [Streptomyces sannanensis]|uniref:HTH merR-type domain-containing protein n=1 Tax=Streptomyces sannanensis TaxID=285536 RepID=A0ABP6SD20_9ACTN
MARTTSGVSPGGWIDVRLQAYAPVGNPYERGHSRRVVEYRIENLAQASGATVRTIRAYQDRGLLPRPERRGRSNVYGETHLARLRQIADLLDRGYSLASIKELLEAWDAGRGLGGVLGLVAEVDGPWTDEKAGRITRAELDEAFGGTPDDAAVEDAVELGVLEHAPGSDDEFLVPSPQELAVAAELHAAGVPLSAIAGHLRQLRGQVEHIAARFLEFTTEHVFARHLGHRPPTDADATEAVAFVRRLRPLAQQTSMQNSPAPYDCSPPGIFGVIWRQGPCRTHSEDRYRSLFRPKPSPPYRTWSDLTTSRNSSVQPLNESCRPGPSTTL